MDRAKTIIGHVVPDQAVVDGPPLCGYIQQAQCSADTVEFSFASDKGKWQDLARTLMHVLDPALETKMPWFAFLQKNRDLYWATEEEMALSVPATRALMRKRLETFVHAGFIKVEDSIQDPMKFIAAHEVLGLIDSALVYCFSVHMNLFGGSVLKLGTDQHKHLLPQVSKMDGVRGCFCLTELAHGAASGASIDTEAVWDKANSVFHLRTPTWEAQKGWVSFGAYQATHGVVWAELVENGKRKGPHLFVTQLRDFKTEKAMPGVTLSDRGVKSCLNGNDNGKMSFDSVELPKSALLDRFTRIDKDGNYETDIAKPQELFNKFTDALLSGRLVVATCVLVCCRHAVIQAVRYASTRKVHQRKGEPLRLWDFASHRRALYPRLAETYAVGLAINAQKKAFAAHALRHFNHDGSLKTTPAEYSEDTDKLSNDICALNAHNAQRTLQIISVCRDCCGGQGVLALNRLGELNNVAVTLAAAEGDTVLLQQKTSRQLLTDMLKSGPPEEPEAAPLAKGLASEALPERLAAIEGLLRLREVRILQSLGEKVMAGRGEGLDTMKVWNSRCLPAAQDLHNAFCEHLIFKGFREMADSTTGHAGDVLKELCLLNGLWSLELHLGWFLANVEELDREMGNSIPAQVEAACLAVDEQQLLALVDAYAYPDALLNFPAARGEEWYTNQK